MRCNGQSDFKYIPNYAPSVIAEFNDNHLIIKDFNTRKDFYEFCQCKIDLWKENYNILDPKVGDLIENSFV